MSSYWLNGGDRSVPVGDGNLEGLLIMIVIGLLVWAYVKLGEICTDWKRSRIVAVPRTQEQLRKAAEIDVDKTIALLPQFEKFRERMIRRHMMTN